MSTKLWIESLTQLEIDEDQLTGDCESIELSEEFLYELVVNEDLLRLYLNEEEIESLRPNWGEVQLRESNTLTEEQRSEYLTLIENSIKNNSSEILRDFHRANGLVSNKLIDRAKSPEVTLLAIRKLQSITDQPIQKFNRELMKLATFLQKRIERDELILIEFFD